MRTNPVDKTAYKLPTADAIKRALAIILVFAGTYFFFVKIVFF